MTRTGDFWSRRREAVRAEAEAEKAAILANDESAKRAELEDISDDEILDRLNLPDPDAMKPGDDFSRFMSQAVPERLRRRALRKLWLSNPLLANADGLVDYGEDFTDGALAVENLQTAYQVGKGMLKHVLEMERQREAEEDDVTEIAEAAPTEVDTLTALSTDSEDTEPHDNDIADEPAGADEPELSGALPRPRRMQFTFKTDAA